MYLVVNGCKCVVDEEWSSLTRFFFFKQPKHQTNGLFVKGNVTEYINKLSVGMYARIGLEHSGCDVLVPVEYFYVDRI